MHGTCHWLINIVKGALQNTNLKIENPAKDKELKEGVTSLKILESAGKEASEMGVTVGDDVQLGEFKSTVTGIEKEDGGLVLKIADAYMGGNNNKMDTGEETTSETQTITEVSVFVKRENTRMEDPHAISIAFNLARLHETSGRTIAAVPAPDPAGP